MPWESHPVYGWEEVNAVGEASIGVLAAFVIFPLVFAFGADPADGAGLTFEAMPQVFGEMPAGELWAILFFAGFFIAAITSAVVLSEVGVTAIKEETGLSRDNQGGFHGVVRKSPISVITRIEDARTT